MNEAEKERLIRKDLVSIENKVRHAFNQGYEMGMKDREKLNCTDCIIEKSDSFIKSCLEIPNTCEDAISRQAALDAFWKLNIELSPTAIWTIQNMVKDVPSVSPQQRTGRWIQKEEEGEAEPFIIRECSECHCVDGKPSYKYCPQCGAKMEVEE